LSDWLNRVNKFDPGKTFLTIPRAAFFSVELVRNLFISINTNERSMRKLLFLLACFFLASIGLVSAQSVSGKVISDEDGQPIVGATVAVKGTNIGTLTNGDGVFTVNLRGNSKTLLVTFIGMVSVEAQASNNMVIKMQVDRRMIDEVIVTGLGIKRSEKALGYSASAVTAVHSMLCREKSPESKSIQPLVPRVLQPVSSCVVSPRCPELTNLFM